MLVRQPSSSTAASSASSTPSESFRAAAAAGAPLGAPPQAGGGPQGAPPGKTHASSARKQVGASATKAAAATASKVHQGVSMCIHVISIKIYYICLYLDVSFSCAPLSPWGCPSPCLLCLFYVSLSLCLSLCLSLSLYGSSHSPQPISEVGGVCLHLLLQQTRLRAAVVSSQRERDSTSSVSCMHACLFVCHSPSSLPLFVSLGGGRILGGGDGGVLGGRLSRLSPRRSSDRGYKDGRL